ncbi:N-terminal C2 in EEIG1 and EHBP1 proteins-domain-containing protein [Lasiosphaeria ovina]|uniref:N-terminal C2 in EEIG1 and EHBP1 proteins-domain-containing protein n=1 Tax=Lasiosphaeria ovina TaxID=92902 RepID=A0AAE0JVS2_9PEZI|nr:N-terminal C2 in EEIG1 and EHBP1 proteins-domain-containing protein [Lasiosphaeria ovina]
MQFLPLVNKARKIYDLNNVPLVSGVSLIKWSLPGSIHGEHRGRTQKCPILNHRVDYHYSKLVPVRISIDRNNHLAECPIEFEVLQEFNLGGAGGVIGRDEKITLGTVRLNLSEYIEEGEAILRDGGTAAPASFGPTFNLPGPGDSKSGHHRKRSSLSGLGPDIGSLAEEESVPATLVRDGVVRRYLMQESKINSTLKVSILMVQVDGDRNYVAPPLKTAPVFGGIAGFVANDALEPVDAGANAGQVPSPGNKSGDAFELQDVYRRALAASWACQPGELPADQCIEDIFAGGDGFRTAPSANKRPSSQPRHPHSLPAAGQNHSIRTGGSSGGVTGNSSPSTGGSASNAPREDNDSPSGDDESTDMMATLKPRDMARLRSHLHLHHLRHHSGASDRSTGTALGGDQSRSSRNPDRDRETDRESSRGIGLNLTGNLSGSGSSNGSNRDLTQLLNHRRDGSKDTTGGGRRSRSESLATTIGSDRERNRDGLKRAREVDEFDMRDDLVAWAVPVIPT